MAYRIYTSGGYLKIEDIAGMEKTVSMPVQYTKYHTSDIYIYISSAVLGGLQNARYRSIDLFQPNGTPFASVDDLLIWLDKHTAIVLTPEVLETIDKKYTHIQFDSALVWFVQHNLSKFPAVSVFDEFNEQIEGSVTHINNTLLNIEFNTAERGVVYCN